MTSKADPVLIFDLDGTVLRVNSFPVWVRQLLLARFDHLSISARLTVAARTAGAVARRKLLRHDHATFKRALQGVWAEAMAGGRHELAAAGQVTRHLLPQVRDNLEPVLRAVADGRVDAVLSTAAAAEYAVPLGQSLGFHHIIATPRQGGGTENIGAAKRDRTLAYLQDQGWGGRRRVFFTDHPDDLPLILECHTILWLGDDDHLETVRAHTGDLPVIPVRAMPGDEILRLATSG
jgi:phosphoserine phosphatase